jgi:type II secretory pathway pseudopilin PulG
VALPATSRLIRTLLRAGLCALLWGAAALIVPPAGNVCFAHAQDPTPSSAINSTGPAAALRDAISAACTQSEQAFSKFLTARNADTFAHLTPAARVALMKRFVLLNEAGKASLVTSTSGRPIVRCEIPGGAAELQIGGPETTDNLSFLPVEVRDATDSSSANVLHVKMGLIRENGEWKLLSVGLVLLDLPSLAAEWDAAEMENTERAAIQSMKIIADAIEAYRHAYARLPDSLDKLAPPPRGPVSPDSAGLLDSEYASGAKNGYSFRYVVVGASTLGAPAKFELAATPQAYNRTGRRSFFRDANGGLHGADHQGAVGSPSDPKVD